MEAKFFVDGILGGGIIQASLFKRTRLGKERAHFMRDDDLYPTDEELSNINMTRDEWDSFTSYCEENHLGPYDEGIRVTSDDDGYHDDDIYYDLDYQDHDDSGNGSSYDDYSDND